MTSEREYAIVSDYLSVISHERKKLSRWYFSQSSPESNQNLVIYLLHHVFEKMLCWSPERTMANITIELLKRLKLDNLINDYIDYPNFMTLANREIKGRTYKGDVQYIVHLMYPDKFPIDEEQEIIKTYHAILDGRQRFFGKGMFEGAEGIERANVLLRHALQLFFLPRSDITTIEDLYELFSKSSILEDLKRVKLDAVSEMLYLHPIEYLHDALGEYGNDTCFNTVVANMKMKDALEKRRKIALRRKKRKAVVNSNQMNLFVMEEQFSKVDIDHKSKQEFSHLYRW